MHVHECLLLSRSMLLALSVDLFLRLFVRVVDKVLEHPLTVLVVPQLQWPVNQDQKAK